MRNTEHNWFWQQGYHDALDGLRAIAPDETRYSFQRSDYFAGYDAGTGYDAGNEERGESDEVDVGGDGLVEQ